MTLGSKHTLISCYAALATIAVGMISYDFIDRQLDAGPSIANFQIESVTHDGNTQAAKTAKAGEASSDRAAL
jgi:hypothetical protein